MSETSASLAETTREDIKAAMKAGDKRRTSALRMILDSLQKEAKFGEGDELAALRREHKKRVEAAEAFAKGGRDESAEQERYEAELIEAYLPVQLGDAELAELVDAAVSETGAQDPSQMGPVIGKVMARAEGRADGKRVSQAVRERLGA